MAAGLTALGLWAGSKSAWAQASFRNGKSSDQVLVVIFLRGGADGLNIAAPYEDDDYFRARPNLALNRPGTTNGVLRLDDQFGLHPRMPEVHQLFADGKAAMIHACGSGDQTRSHFEAMQTMELGKHDQTSGESGGWLARHIASTPDRSSPLRAVALSSMLPDSLAGATGALAIPSISDYQLHAPDGATEVLQSLYGAGRDQIAQAGRDTLKVLGRLKEMDPSSYSPDNGATYPEVELGKAMREAAFLLKSDLGLEVACLDMGGWDTHVTQGNHEGWQANLLSELSQSIGAFFQDIGKEADRTTVIVQTEFGRRIAENSGLGTDHGRGGVMMAFGNRVNGGQFYGDWPGLRMESRDGPGDLRVMTDYRTVLAEALDKILASPDPRAVFPNHAHAPLGIFA